MTHAHCNSSVLYIPHGGGPLPLLGHPGHQRLVTFLNGISLRLKRPDAIVVISAHWEQSIPTLTAGKSPSLIYDYDGFPAEAYEISYPVQGSVSLAHTLYSQLKAKQIRSRCDERWGLDHGVFVPLKLMYPDADIPCVQLSLKNGLDPLDHLNMGRALGPLKTKNLLFLGSGFSFHNMKAFNTSGRDEKNIEFDDWLIKTMTDPGLSVEQRADRLIEWENAPHARYCHPTQEHLLPLHVCLGIAGTSAQVAFNDDILGKRATAFLWPPKG